MHGPHAQDRGGKVLGGRLDKKETIHEPEMRRREGIWESPPSVPTDSIREIRNEKYKPEKEDWCE